MSPRKPAASKLAATPAEADRTRTRTLPLAHGRTLALVHSAGDDLVELRGADGGLELRIRMTAEGPVLQMESLRLSLKAAEEVQVQCRRFDVQTTEDLRLDAGGDVRVTGTLIHLN